MRNYTELSEQERLSYEALLQTQEWHDLRTRLLKEANYNCCYCDACGETTEVTKSNGTKIQMHIPYRTYDVIEEDDEYGIPRVKVISTVVMTNPIIQVHHTYYVKSTLPWEYPDECFKVVCKRCHTRIHEEEEIMMYANHMFKDGVKLTPCNRCEGLGYLYEFNYHMDGICFGCKGAGFEELISEGNNTMPNSQENNNLETDKDPRFNYITINGVNFINDGDDLPF